MFFRRKASPGKETGNAPRVGVALAMKRKGTLSTYVLEADGTAKAMNERVEATLTITYDEDERRIPVPGRIGYHAAYRRFRQQYQVSREVTSFFEEETPALHRMSQDFSRTLVSDILEAF